MLATTKSVRPVAYLLSEVDNDLGDTTGEDAKCGQDITIRINLHKVRLPLLDQMRGIHGVGINHQ